MLSHEAAIEEKLRTTEADLTAKIDVLRSDLVGVERRLEAKIDGVERRLEAKIDGVEQRLTVTIHSEVSSAVGHAVERFSELFGLFDEKYGDLVVGVRQDLDEHRFDRSVHLQPDRGPGSRSRGAQRKAAARPAPRKKKPPPRR